MSSPSLIFIPHRVLGVNVNTTDATTGATELLLPAQNEHTLHDPIRDTEHARAGGDEDGLGVGGLDGGAAAVEMLATTAATTNVVREEAAGGRVGVSNYNHWLCMCKNASCHRNHEPRPRPPTYIGAPATT